MSESDLVVIDEAYSMAGYEAGKQYASGGIIPKWGDETLTWTADPSAPLPHQCPHGCKRDHHPDPLTQQVAAMYDSHQFRADYSAADDDSPIVCVGADFHGPNRAPTPRATSSWSTLEWVIPKVDMSSWTDMFSKLAGSFDGWPKLTLYSGSYMPMWTSHPNPEPLEQCDVPDGITVTFDNDWKPWDKPWIDMSELAAARKLTPHITAAAHDFPVPTAPGYDFSEYAEAANKKPYYLGVK